MSVRTRSGHAMRCPNDGREIGPTEQRFVVVDSDGRGEPVEVWYCRRECYLASRYSHPVARAGKRRDRVRV